MLDQNSPAPGLIILFGSGETSPTGRKVFEQVFRSLRPSPRLALLETPAGFELNSHQVISRVGDFFTHRLQNFTPRVEIISARKRGTKYSPDDPAIVAPMLKADLIFMGPGSPSYAVRQLQDSLAWYYLIARHRLGAVLALASAATVAFSAYALPIYEIYKAGVDIHWIAGLDFFKPYGLQLIFIPHWNNNEGGPELDTSRCFMGEERFQQLVAMLPQNMTIIGLDENTTLIMDLSAGTCQVKGLGKVTLLHTGHKHRRVAQPTTSVDTPVKIIDSDEDTTLNHPHLDDHIQQYGDGQDFPLQELGPFHSFQPEAILPPAIWQIAYEANRPSELLSANEPSDEIQALVCARQEARRSGKWALADKLRTQIEALGWQVQDTMDGPLCRKVEKKIKPLDL